MSFNDVNFFPDKRIEFIRGIEENLAKVFEVKKENVQVFALEKGSIDVYTLVKNLNYRTKEYFYMHNLLNGGPLYAEEKELYEASILIRSANFNHIAREYSWLKHYFLDSIVPRKRGPPNKEQIFHIPHKPWCKIGMQVES
mmetsp:Transcript_11824/g.8617  ORF Transcript_11824/g.8617 Transcript_11824/m.8617 type:complete len:141 (+) Transcript_11824:452-874(+)|eukprot:CAMPEP_0202980218 /NCGR_PEP_ID=MMETSP1396-20130829/86182_1 /ASSEMBLY_ACC=CAM_ASM_000872 /TAXON_ID= /ORGANISM="Pseudokeronopsis sp., Strain Brazil" /LENGTH=140 /DNA_ID=CAMNT_0049720047 /DNA_START=432 /DNA_END=854 /DNA_ORIENTATION=-